MKKSDLYDRFSEKKIIEKAALSSIISKNRELAHLKCSFSEIYEHYFVKILVKCSLEP